MDKSTLSNYGWIVIAVLVLAVMIALATPFGTYIKSGVESTTAGLFDTSEKAMNVVGMSAGNGSFESGSGETETVVAGATTKDGTFLTWDELKLAENGTKYGYNASAITDTSIGDGAFEECESFTSIVLPINLKTIGNNSFNWAVGFQNISISHCVELTTIGNNAFNYCYYIKNIDISNCTKLTTIGINTFNCCNSLTGITMPNSVTTIEDGAFGNCVSLTSITIPNNVTTIGNDAFGNCTSLTSVTMPNNVTTIENNAFSICTSLTTVNYTGTAEEWSAISIGKYNDALTSATINYNYIGE